MNIRAATILDIVQLSKCSKECLPVYYTKFDFLYYLLLGDYLILVSTTPTSTSTSSSLREEIIGYILVDKNGNTSSNISNDHIVSLCVLPKYRRYKLATKMIKNIINMSSNSSITLYVSVENKIAIECYKKLDFNVNKLLKNYYSNINSFSNKDAYLMKKLL